MSQTEATEEATALIPHSGMASGAAVPPINLRQSLKLSYLQSGKNNFHIKRQC